MNLSRLFFFVCVSSIGFVTGCQQVDTVKEKVFDLFVKDKPEETEDSNLFGRVAEFSSVAWVDDYVAETGLNEETEAVTKDLMRKVFAYIELRTDEIVEENQKTIKYLVKKTAKGNDISGTHKYADFEVLFRDGIISGKSIEIFTNRCIVQNNSNSKIRLMTVMLDNLKVNEIIDVDIFNSAWHQWKNWNTEGKTTKEINDGICELLKKTVLSRYALFLEKENIIAQMTDNERK